MTQEVIAQREDTMIYRSPAADSDQTAIQDIWGERLEVRTVDASEVPALLAEGWVTHPMDVGNKGKPEEAAGFEPVKGEALEAAEKLAEALTEEVAQLKGEVKDLTVERDMLKDSVAETETQRDATRQLAAENGKLADERQAEIAKLTADLVAAEDLADSEGRAKDAALAEVATLKAAAAKSEAKKGG